jgi:hypothetical protein
MVGYLVVVLLGLVIQIEGAFGVIDKNADTDAGGLRILPGARRD